MEDEKMKQIPIPTDIMKSLEEIKKKHRYPIKQQIVEALMTHIVVMRETDFILENKDVS